MEIPKMNLTHKLNQMIARDIVQYPDDGAKQRFLYMIKDIYDSFERVFHKSQKNNNVKKRVKRMHEFLDYDVKRNLKPSKDSEKVSCGKGCSACCYLNVVVTNDEAEVLAGLYDGQSNEKLKRQANRAVDDFEYPRQLGRSDAACIFLKDNACSVYANRPAVCRVYHVVSPAEECDVYLHPKEMVKQVIHKDSEFLMSAAYQHNGCDRLARQLIKVLKLV